MSSRRIDERQPIRIVQCAREIGVGFGVSGPAYALEIEFRRRGYRCESFTLRNLGLTTRPRGGALRLWRDIIVFTFWGTARIWWRYRHSADAPTVLVCHVDALIGDVFVVRALPKAYWLAQQRRAVFLLRNPLQALVILRDEIRFRLGVHRRIIALSEQSRTELGRLYGIDARAIRVIPNGVDTARFRPCEQSRREVRKELGWAANTFVLLFAANDFVGKGLRIVLRALRTLNDRGTDCGLIVAGRDSPGRYRSELAATDGLVRVVGHRTDVERYFAAADAFVLPTAYDISPLVGKEALASGLPLLMTDVGGIREFLRDGENGFFVRPDAADIAERAALLAADAGSRREMSRAARETALTYDWGEIADRYLEVIHEVVAERRFSTPAS